MGDRGACSECGWHKCSGGTNRHMRVAAMRGKKLCFRGNSFPAADLACAERVITRLRSELAAKEARVAELEAKYDQSQRALVAVPQRPDGHVYPEER